MAILINFGIFTLGLLAGAGLSLGLPFLLCGPRPQPAKRGRKPRTPKMGPLAQSLLDGKGIHPGD